MQRLAAFPGKDWIEGAGTMLQLIVLRDACGGANEGPLVHSRDVRVLPADRSPRGAAPAARLRRPRPRELRATKNAPLRGAFRLVQKAAAISARGRYA